ncbi:hypothetical protein EBBID32_8150 [Sphingobium indicum BiD32]|uniref:Uncharacterized protein n=1 Tax=Sphingobium indicum BiD32 TaxID=1301087 RepID=N1MI67_9SPHN|nr:hypothetical protein [Sphingobium indicum]CCW16479.1 hypothetical protein EBBID32_8150 [Sphingobium indicum BiD32]
MTVTGRISDAAAIELSSYSDHFGYVIAYDRQRPQLALADASPAPKGEYR